MGVERIVMHKFTIFWALTKPTFFTIWRKKLWNPFGNINKTIIKISNKIDLINGHRSHPCLHIFNQPPLLFGFLWNLNFERKCNRLSSSKENVHSKIFSKWVNGIPFPLTRPNRMRLNPEPKVANKFPKTEV